MDENLMNLRHRVIETSNGFLQGHRACLDAVSPYSSKSQMELKTDENPESSPLPKGAQTNGEKYIPSTWIELLDRRETAMTNKEKIQLRIDVQAKHDGRRKRRTDTLVPVLTVVVQMLTAGAAVVSASGRSRGVEEMTALFRSK